jgi:hypothetical protein
MNHERSVGLYQKKADALLKNMSEMVKQTTYERDAPMSLISGTLFASRNASTLTIVWVFSASCPVDGCCYEI